MITTSDDGDEDNLRYAEYVLGVLDADTRAAVAHEVATMPEAAVAVTLWQRRLTPLADAIDEVEPSSYVWARIRDTLQLDAPAPLRARKGLWDNLQLWRWFGFGAAAAALALLVVVYLPRPAVAPSVVKGYMASTLQQDDGAVGWTVALDTQHARMVVIPATPAAFGLGRAPELWLIPAGAKPISVGMIARDKPTTLALDSALLARVGVTAVFAVSVEPIGGSRTGQPTGPVIAKGAIGAAPQNLAPDSS
jgi:anti-sigma-K factor RskA